MKRLGTLSWTICLVLTAAAAAGTASPARAGFSLSVGSGGLYVSVGHYDHPWSAVTVAHDADAYDLLYDYGEWRYIHSAGTELWFPFVEAGWRPYLHGHWIHTAHGMTWVAYEPWGWLPHHYGNWIWVESFGWGWVPGYEYAPAWVEWGVIDGYVGWAPLPPSGFRYARACTYRYPGDPRWYGYAGRHVYPSSGIDFSLWVFISNDHFHGRNVYVHALPPDRCVRFFHSRRVLPVGRHIDVRYVRRVSRTTIHTVSVERQTYRVGKHRIVHYRPHGQAERIRKAEPTVRRVVQRAPDSRSSYRKSAKLQRGEWPDREEVRRNEKRLNGKRYVEKKTVKRTTERSKLDRGAEKRVKRTHETTVKKRSKSKKPEKARTVEKQASSKKKSSTKKKRR